MGRWMTIEQKRALIQQNEEKPEMTHAELAEWAASKFKLAQPPARYTVCDIMKKSDQIKDKAHGGEKRRKPLKVAAPALERKLGEWVGMAAAKKVTLNRRILTVKAQQIQSDSGGDALDLKLSVGWLSAFVKRPNLRFRLMNGEAGSVDWNVVHEGLRELHELIDHNDLRDVFKVDECGLFYSQAPTRGICTPGTPGVKLDKTRITVILCANAEGSELLPVLFIGRAARSRCFRGKSAADYGYSYKSNKNAWMTSSFVRQWLRELDARMRAEGRNVLLLFDNASLHSTGDLVPTHVTFKRLPPNTTSCLQPMDAGVIASFKSRFRTKQINRAIDRIDSGEDVAGAKVYIVDQLAAMRWSKEIWCTTSAATVNHCWHHTGLVLPVRYGEPDDDGGRGHHDDRDGVVSTIGESFDAIALI